MWVFLREIFHAGSVSFQILACLELSGDLDNFVKYCRGRDIVHAVVIVVHATFVPIHRTWSAWKVELHGVIRILPITVESCKRVCGSPYGYDWSPDQRGDMHRTGIHGDHDVDI